MSSNKMKNQIQMNSGFIKRFQISLFILMIILSSMTIIILPSAGANGIGVVPLEYPSIQAAIDDTTISIIHVLPGTYAESLDVYRSVAIYGLYGADDTILDVPTGMIGMRIRTSDVFIQGFKIEGGTTGIYVASDPPGSTLLEIYLENLEVLSSSDDGILFEDSTGTIKNSWIHDNAGKGLEVLDVSELTVIASTFSSNGDAAIACTDCAQLYFIANLVEGHAIAWQLTSVNDCVIQQNLVEGIAGIRLIGGSGNFFEENIMELESFAFRFEEGTSSTVLNQISGNILENIVTGGTAIDLDETQGNQVNDNIIIGPWDTGLSLNKVWIGDFEGNVISGPDTGVIIEQGDNLIFEGNVIIDGTSYGIRVNEADNVEITGNVIVGSYLGLATTGEVLNLLVDGNVFSENDVAIKIEGPARTTSVNHNVVDSNVLGVDFFDTVEGTITYNIITENINAGIQTKECDDILIAHNEVVVGGLAGVRVLDSGSSSESLIIELNNISTEVPQPYRGSGDPPGSGCKLYGIEVQNSNLIIQDNIIEGIVHEPGLEDYDSGYGIYVKASEDVHIINNTVDGYQKYGILVEEPPTLPLSPGGIQEIPIKNNIILGLGTAFSSNQVGIMVRGGANSSPQENLVKYNWYNEMDKYSIGIGIFDSPYEVNVLHNIVEENQYGIYLKGCVGSNISYNSAIGNVQGIRVENSGGTDITSNEAIGPIPPIYGYVEPPPSIGINVINSPNVEAVSNIINNHITGIRAMTSDDILLRLNSITGSNVAGIHLSGGYRALIEENYVSFGEDGIILTDETAYDVVTNNLVENNKRGIIVNHCYITSVTWNEVRDGNIAGIQLQNDGATYVYMNVITNHGTGIKSIGSNAVYVDKNDVLDNEVDGIYLKSAYGGGIIKRNELKGNGAGIFATGRWNEFVVAHNNIENNGMGVCIVADSSDISVEFNQITRNTNHGVYISENGTGNTIFRNIIMHNDETGIKVEGDRNNVDRNTVNNNNEYGIWATKSSEANTFTRNVVKSNKPYDARDDSGKNFWTKNQIGKWYPGP